jgi:hypothetical protein
MAEWWQIVLLGVGDASLIRPLAPDTHPLPRILAANLVVSCCPG